MAEAVPCASHSRADSAAQVGGKPEAERASHGPAAAEAADTGAALAKDAAAAVAEEVEVDDATAIVSFGPAGWIVLGVTAVAGLVAVLAGGGDAKTLEGAAGRAAAAGIPARYRSPASGLSHPLPA